LAQDAQPSESSESTASKDTNAALEEVVVTGFRGSINAALDEKKSNSGVVDVIKAEDIADFPDSNLAESIQRVPGVSISRVAGEGKAITVRGLGPNFTRVRINGMEAQSLASGTTSDRGPNLSRGFDFNVFASELFNSIAVRKTTSAEVPEGSLGATVDLTTAHPFDFRGFTFVTNLQGNYNDLSEDLDPRASFLVSNTWADGKFGALLSAAYSQRHYYEEEFGSGGWNPATTDGGFCSPVGAATQNPANDAARGTNALNCAFGVPRPPANDPAYQQVNQSTVFLPRLPRYGRFEHDQERLGITGSFQWQVADSTLLTLDTLYSNYDVEREESWLEGFSFARAISQQGKPQTAIRSATLLPRGVSHTQGTNFGQNVYDILTGTFDGVDVRSDLQHDEWESNFKQFTLSGKHEINDRLTLNALAGYSKSKLAQPVSTTIMYQRPNATMTVDFSDPDKPVFTHGFDVTDPTQYTFAPGNAEVRMAPIWVDNEFSTGDVNLAYKLNDNINFKVGARYTDYSYDSRAAARANNFDVPTFTADQLASLTTLTTGFGSGGLEGRFPSSWSKIDYDAFVNAVGLYSGTGMWALQDVQLAVPRSNIRSVGEKDTSLYLQQDFKLEARGIPIRGDVGVRWARTDLESTGYRVTVAPTQVTAKNHYDDFLPALNLVGELTPEVLGRFSAAKVISRPPDINYLTPGGTINLGGTPNSSTGNPYLEPIRADTYDLSAEWYFSRGSLLSLGLFYKDIKTYIQNQAVQMSYRQTGLPLELLVGTQIDPDNTPFTVNRPVNTPGGPLKGFEVNYQQAFSFLPGWLSNFGTLLNYTYVESKITYYLAQSATTTTEDDLLGLSKNAYNATLYWENAKFSARISGAYRDKFLEALPANNPLQDVEGTDSMLTFDGSASYNVSPHFKLSLEALNLFDEYKRQYIDSDRDSTFVYGHTGRQVSLGVQYKF
jgi:TonB-dependent receptor